jgi:hypothetical protein
MNSKLIVLLLALCTLLVLLISGEWLYAKKAQKELLDSTSPSSTKKSSDEFPTIELTKQPEESYEDMVARPLFIKGRKPVDEPKPDDPAVPAVAVVFDWELSGIYTKNKTLSALFSRAKAKVPKDNYRKITVGTDLDGWKLTEIRKDRAIFTQAGTQKELLLRKPKPKQPHGDRNNPAIPNQRQVPNPGSIPNPEIIPPPESPEEPFENSTDEQQF